MIALILVLQTYLCAGQRSAAQSSAKSFRWNPKDIQELGPEDTLSRSNDFSAADRNALIDLMMGHFRSGGDEEASLPRTELRTALKETRIKVVDLNGDGKPEIIAQANGSDAGCSPTGNCSIWIFARSARIFKIILNRGSIQTLTIQPTKTHGFRDLVLGMHGSATEQELHLYRWDGNQYGEAACYDANWTRLVNGEVQDLKEPDISPCGR